MIVLLLLLCGCTIGENNLNTNLSPKDMNIKDLVTKIYTENQLTNVVGFNGTINELSCQYPIECIRAVKNGYRIVYCGKNCFGVFFFDENGKKISGDIYEASQTKFKFNTISVGQSLEDVKKLDQKGNYIFLYTGRADIPRVSTHYTSDGYLITITYDDNNIISKIDFELI